ncbi:MAG: nuclease-related domain-containing protein [Clostridium sp.]
MMRLLLSKNGITYIILLLVNYRMMDRGRVDTGSLTIVSVILIGIHLLIYFTGKMLEKKWTEVKRDILGMSLMGIVTVCVINLMVMIEVGMVGGFIRNGYNSLIGGLIQIVLIGLFALGMPVAIIGVAKWLIGKVANINEIDEKKNLQKRRDVVLDKIDELMEKFNIEAEANYPFEAEKFYMYNERMNFEETKTKKLYCTNDLRNGELKEQLCEIEKLEQKILSVDIMELIQRRSCLRDTQNRWIGNLTQKEIKLRKLLECRKNILEVELENIENGIKGEKLVDDELNQYPNIYNLSNIRLEEEDNNGIIQSIENDNIIIARQGVFVIEVKNIGFKGSFSIDIERDGRWVKSYGERKEIMKSPTEQNNRHILYINKIINRVLGRGIQNYVDADGIVVIANDKVSITNQSQNQIVLRKSEIYLYIKKQKNSLSLEEMNILRDYFLKKDLGGKKFHYNDYAFELKENIEDYNTVVNQVKQDVLEMKKLAVTLDEIK